MTEYTDLSITETTKDKLEDIKEKVEFYQDKGKDVTKYQKKSSKVSKDEIVKQGLKKLEDEGVLHD